VNSYSLPTAAALAPGPAAFSAAPAPGPAIPDTVFQTPVSAAVAGPALAPAAGPAAGPAVGKTGPVTSQSLPTVRRPPLPCLAKLMTNLFSYFESEVLHVAA
jgi:hypothetical protein